MTGLSTHNAAAPAEVDVVTRIVMLGCVAPSVQAAQPWRWHITARRVELSVDRSRQLEMSNSHGRNLMISCGAVLHHVQVAAAGLGWASSVTRFPDAGDPLLVAIVDLHPGPPPAAEDVELLRALERRKTPRRRFMSCPIPEEQLASLASVKPRWGARVLPLTGKAARATVERLVDRALEYQARDARYLAEQVARVDVTPSATPQPIQDSDRVLAICTTWDDQAAWLDAGETLSATWLQAVQAGFSLEPLSQVIEFEETRQALRDEVFYSMAQPQLLVRVAFPHRMAGGDPASAPDDPTPAARLVPELR